MTRRAAGRCDGTADDHASRLRPQRLLQQNPRCWPAVVPAAAGYSGAASIRRRGGGRCLGAFG
eukprot:1739812-Alexandrium_andersonii.AAC.1